MTAAALATPQLMDLIARRIVEGYQPDGIFLFGSYAAGSPSADSDIDLLVVKKTADSPMKRHAAVRRLLRGFVFPMDILVYTPEEMEARKGDPDSFLNHALAAARPLYVKS